MKSREMAKEIGMKTNNGHQIGRREFLLVSTTCAVAAATVGPKLFGAEAVASPKRLAVGFAAAEGEMTVVDAGSIPAGDGRFIGRGARVTVSGASGMADAPRSRRGVELLTHFSYFEGSERRDAPFRAWGCSRTTGCQGSAVSFNVPVDDVQAIRFTVGVQSGAVQAGERATRRDAASGPLEKHALPVTLSLQNEPGSLKLVRGYYVIVPLFENDAEPRWSAWKLGLVDGRMALVDSNGAIAPFEHLVVRTDYAP
jgi:hypothetical protein